MRIWENIPQCRLLLNELPHQLNTLPILQYHHLNPPVLEILLAPNEIHILSDYHPLDLVQDTCTCAHIAGR